MLRAMPANAASGPAIEAKAGQVPSEPLRLPDEPREHTRSSRVRHVNAGGRAFHRV